MKWAATGATENLMRHVPLVVLTIGHSTHPLDEFAHMLQAHAVKRVVDIRTVPRSRRNPQYSGDTLPDGLRPFGIDYTHLPGLGGLRHTRRDSPNAGWHNLSFRGYADHMATVEFADALETLLALARDERTAMMCAEAVPWRCHRRLVGDALLVRGIVVEDILSATRRTPHTLTPWAHVEGTRITYPPTPAEATNADANGEGS
jgi:uncharacterized protein (DUF488 family)